MPRISKEECVGLALLDRLFHYQLKLHLVCDADELSWYQEIGTSVRRVVEKEGSSGIQTEGLIHDILWELERKFPPTVDAVLYSRKPYGLGHHPPEKVAELAAHILDALPIKPKPWFFNLNEKVLLAECPDAPVKVMAWLAQKDIVTPAKPQDNDIEKGSTRGPSRQEPDQLDLLAYRAVLLLQAENWRTVMVKNAADSGTRSLDDLLNPDSSIQSEVLAVVTRTLLDTPNLPRSDVASIMVRVQRGTRMLGEAFDDRAFITVNPAWWQKNQSTKMREYFGKISRVIEVRGGFISTKAKAVSLLAAGIVMLHEKYSDKKARFSVINGDASGCSTGLVRAQFTELGFKVQARTINSHLPKSGKSSLFEYLDWIRTEYRKSQRAHRHWLPNYQQMPAP